MARRGGPFNLVSRSLLHREHRTAALDGLRNVALLTSVETSQLAGQDLTRLGDVTGEGLGIGEIEIEGIFGAVRLTVGAHGRV